MFLFTTQIAASHLHSLFSPVPWSWSHKGPCRNKAQCLDQAARPRGWEVPLVIWAGIPREITASKSDRNNQVMIRKEKKNPKHPSDMIPSSCVDTPAGPTDRTGEKSPEPTGPDRSAVLKDSCTWLCWAQFFVKHSWQTKNGPRSTGSAGEDGA